MKEKVKIIKMVIMSLLRVMVTITTAQKMKISIKDLLSKYGQIHSFLRIWSHLLKKSLMENFIFCALHDNRSCITMISTVKPTTDIG